MKNPFRSEAEAYRFVMGTVVYFAAIVIATAVGGRWWGLGAFVVVTVGGAALGLLPAELVSARRSRRHGTESVEGERRILVVANETVAGGALRDAIEVGRGGGARERPRRLSRPEHAA